MLWAVVLSHAIKHASSPNLYPFQGLCLRGKLIPTILLHFRNFRVFPAIFPLHTLEGLFWSDLLGV